MGKRAAFITIGQAPRPDIVDEMRPFWPGELLVEEFGALDGLSREAINGLAPSAPQADDARLVSRLQDGSEVTLRAEAVHEKVHAIVERCDRSDYDFLVLLCTGKFDALRSKHLLLKAQPIVDHGVEAFAAASSKLGVLVPLAEQMASVDAITSYASPYDGDRFRQAAGELAQADLIVMHCMGYSDAMREKMAELTGKPVLLARRMVATAVAQLL